MCGEIDIVDLGRGSKVRLKKDNEAFGHDISSTEANIHTSPYIVDHAVAQCWSGQWWVRLKQGNLGLSRQLGVIDEERQHESRSDDHCRIGCPAHV
jgi:hypothetical protein